MANNEVNSSSLLDLIERVKEARDVALDKAREFRGSNESAEFVHVATRLDSAVTNIHWLRNKI